MNIENDLDELEAYLGFKPTTKVRHQKSKGGFFKRLFGRKKKADEWG